MRAGNGRKAEIKPGTDRFRAAMLRKVRVPGAAMGMRSTQYVAPYLAPCHTHHRSWAQKGQPTAGEEGESA